MTTNPQPGYPFAQPAPKKSNAGKIIAIIAAAIGALCLSGIVLAACVGNSVDDNRAAQIATESDQDARNRAAATGQASTPPATTAPAATTTAPPPAATTAPAKPAKPAPVRIGDGVYTVGEDMPAGRYKVVERAEELCYWSRTKGGNIIDNGIGGGFPTFTAKKGEQIEISSCPEFELRK